jgi:hypothetical protein
MSKSDDNAAHLPDRPEQSGEQSTDPRRKTRRAVLIALISVLIALGGAALGMGLYVSHQSEGFELTLTFGPRTTHVIGTDVRLEEKGAETRCVLSLFDFRAVRDESLFLFAVAPVTQKPGAPTFTIAVNELDRSVVNSGALPKGQLEPLDAFVISHAKACLKHGE